jgi:sialic acid synthase SpsE
VTVANFGARRVGAGEPLLVIAEVGVNHNGDRELGLRQLRAAADAGADAVKVQSFRADELATEWAPSAEYQLAGGGDRSQREMLRLLELGSDDLAALFAEGRKRGIVAFTTPFDPDSARLAASLGAPWMKVPSGEVTNHELIGAIASTHLPTLLSTGMTTLEEIGAAVRVYREGGGGPLVLLHCISSYPAPLEEMNLRAIPVLEREFGVPVGLSDHTIGRDAAVAALALGAAALEKHFTIDRSLPGPDQAMSMEPAPFAEMIDVLRRLGRGGLGSGEKRPSPTELPIMEMARRSIVAAKPISAGTRLTREVLAVKRPAGGLGPELLATVIGRRTKRALQADERLALEDLEDAKPD